MKTDPRSHACTIVERIESVVEGRAAADVASYSINGRSLTKIAIPELIEWRARFKSEYLREFRKKRARNRIAASSTVLVRFSRLSSTDFGGKGQRNGVAPG